MIFKNIIKKSLNSVGLSISRVKSIRHKPNEILFLHIGKNAGTQVMHIATQLKDYGIQIKKFNHTVKLSHLPLGSKYFFSIRNPADRFLSGFYSRKRKGLPRIYSDWNMHEKIAFDNFEHGNDLAENLFSPGQKGISARQAIKSISHTGMQQVDWFESAAFFKIQPPLTIVRREFFEKDMQKLLDILNIKVRISSLLSENNSEAHVSDYYKTPMLSKKALTNLKKWYIQDYMFYDFCEEWLKKNKHIS